MRSPHRNNESKIDANSNVGDRQHVTPDELDEFEGLDENQKVRSRPAKQDHFRQDQLG